MELIKAIGWGAAAVVLVALMAATLYSLNTTGDDEPAGTRDVMSVAPVVPAPIVPLPLYRPPTDRPTVPVPTIPQGA